MQRVNLFLNKTKEYIEKYYYIILILTYGVFLITRFYKLSSLPYGVHIDEAAGALDGYYLSKYGMDRNQWRMPPHLMNFHNGQSSLYAYSAAIVFKFLPFSIKALRLPPIIWGSVAFLFSYKLAKELFNGDKAIAVLAPIFVTIFPYYMSSQRWGLDCNLYLSLVTVSLYLFIMAMKTEKVTYYVISGFWMGLTLYSYAISYVVTIVFLILMFAYMLYLKKFDFKKWVYMGIPCFIMALPLILFILVNMGMLPEMYILGSDIKRMLTYRGGNVSLSNVFYNAKFLHILWLGGDGLNYNAFDVPWFGTVYTFMVPVILIGTVWSIVDAVKKLKNKEFDGFSVIIIFFVSCIIVQLLVEGPGINHANQIYITFVLFALYAIVKIAKKWSLFTPVLLAVALVSFGSYCYFYFFQQTEHYGRHILHYGTECFELVRYAEANYNPFNDKTVYLEQDYGDAGAEFFLLSALKDVPPQEFDYDATEYKNVKLHFPENFEITENAIYILGDNWNHISSYLVSVGFMADYSFEGYTILYR